MRDVYYINPDTSQNPNNNNEVHRLGCDSMPDKREYLGFFNNCVDAVAYAKENDWPDADGCAICCPEANTDK